MSDQPLFEILDEIEARMKDVQGKEYDSISKFRKAMEMSADDVPALVKALRRAINFSRMIHDTTPQWRDSALSLQAEIASILKGNTP